MNDPKLMDALSNASSLELFELSTIIDRLLADPRRIIAVRSKLHLGQTVRFLNWRNGQMLAGKIVEMKDRQVTLHEEGARVQWKLSYAAIDPPVCDGQAHTPKADQPPPPLNATRNDFRCGEKVAFTDRYLQPQIGFIVRINQRTATVDCDGLSWRVPFAMLRHVIDI